MSTELLPWHASLGQVSRLRHANNPIATPVSLKETAALLLCGGMAAVGVMLFEYKLKIPGHAILRAVFPMALGLALVPRRGAGVVMGAGAIGTAACISGFGWGEKGLGAMTSLCLIGPALDLAMRRVPTGRLAYLSLIAAGVITNVAAFTVQVVAKLNGWDSGGGKRMAEWLLRAGFTYPLCGAAAGLLSAVVWFRWKSAAADKS